MVNYIRLGTKKPDSDEQKSDMKKYLAIGAAILVISAASVEYIRNMNHWKPRAQAVFSINSPASLEYRLNHLKDDVKEYPEYADRMISDGIKAIKENESQFSNVTYMLMFDAVKDKIEQKPELLDHLGPNALKYQETKMIRTYKEKLQDSYLSIKKKTVETKDKIRDMFTDKKVE